MAYNFGLKKDEDMGYQGRDREKKRWADREIAFLNKHLMKMSYLDIGLALGRTCNSVQQKASIMGLKRKKRWTSRELEQLRKIYHKRPLDEVTEMLGRSPAVVYAQAKKMGISRTKRPWTNAQLKFLKNNYRLMTARELSGHVGHSLLTVRTKSYMLGLIKQPLWTEKDKQYLKRHYEKDWSTSVAEVLGRSIDAVELMAAKVGLRCIYWTKEEEDKLRKLYPKNSNKWLAQKFERSVAAVMGRARKLGLRKEIRKRKYRRSFKGQRTREYK